MVYHRKDRKCVQLIVNIELKEVHDYIFFTKERQAVIHDIVKGLENLCIREKSESGKIEIKFKVDSTDCVIGGIKGVAHAEADGSVYYCHTEHEYWRSKEEFKMITGHEVVHILGFHDLAPSGSANVEGKLVGSYPLLADGDNQDIHHVADNVRVLTYWDGKSWKRYWTGASPLMSYGPDRGDLTVLDWNILQDIWEKQK